MQNKVVLGYWGMRGRAQFSRFLLEYCDIPYENKVYTPQDWFGKGDVELQQKGLTFVNLPYLIDGDFMLSESVAIEQYIIKKGKKKDELLGIGLQQQAQIQMLVGFIRDLGDEIIKLNMNPNFDQVRRQVWNTEILWRLNTIEAHIPEKGLFLFGKKPTYTDFVLYEFIQYVKGIFPNGFQNFDKINALLHAFEMIPQVNRFMNSERFQKFPFLPPQRFRFTGIPQAKLLLGYWGGTRFRAQVSRLLMVYTGQEYDEKLYYSKEEWFQQDAPKFQQQGFLFPNLPYLIDGYQVSLSEATAVERYIIRRAGVEFERELLGENFQELANIMMMHGVINDFREQMVQLAFNKDFENVKETAWKEWVRPNLLLFTQSLKAESKFITGNNVTYVDFVMYEAIDFTALMFSEHFSEFKLLSQFRHNFEQLERVRQFMNSSKYIKVPFFNPSMAAWSGVDAKSMNNASPSHQQSEQLSTLGARDGSLVLGYWGGTRFRVQVSRLLLQYTGQLYDEKLYYSKEDWFNKDAPKLNSQGFVYTNLPFLIDGSQNVSISEAPAIERYIIRRAGQHYSVALLGKNAQETANIMMLHGVINDFRESMVKLAFNREFEKVKEQAWNEWVKGNLQLFSQCLKPTSKFLFGDYETYADFVMYEALDFAYLMFSEQFHEFRRLRTFQHNFEQLQGIKQFMQSSNYIRVPFFFPTMAAWSGVESPQTMAPLLPKMVLGYWGGTRFRVQVSRLMLEYTGQDYQEKLYYKFDEWFANDDKKLQQQNFQFTNLPYLLDGERVKVSEASAIEKYIAKRAGHGYSSELLGSTIQEQGYIQMLVGVFNDFREEMVQLSFNKEFNDVKDKAWTTWIKDNLDLFEKCLADSRKFICSDKPTYADFVLYEAIEFAHLMFPHQFEKQYNKLLQFKGHFELLEGVNQYINSSRYIKVPFFFPSIAQWTGLPKLVLGYWDIRFRAQVSRLLLEFTDQAYEEKKITDPNDWFTKESPNFKNNQGFNFVNLPYLIDGDLKLSESHAIERYIINRAGTPIRKMLLGNDDQESANILMLTGIINDMREAIVDLAFNKDFENAKKDVWEKGIKEYLNLIGAFLSEKQFLFGDSLTYADFVLYEGGDLVRCMFKDQFTSQFQNINRFLSQFESIDKVKKYHESQRYRKVPFFPNGIAAWTGL